MAGYVWKGTCFDEPEIHIGGPGFKPENCGQPKNYRMHLRYNVPVCDACRDASNEYDREKRRKAKAKAGG